jgi:hypothetical protein
MRTRQKYEQSNTFIRTDQHKKLKTISEETGMTLISMLTKAIDAYLKTLEREREILAAESKASDRGAE